MKVFNIIRNIFAAIAVAILIAAAACFAFHLKPAVIMSESMKPTFPVGSVVLVQMGSSYEIGDAIAFHVGGAYVTHRLVGEEDGLYITKGDYNPTDDPGRIAASDIDGKILLCIPFVGRVIRFASSKPGIIVIGALILCVLLSMFISEDEDGTKKEKAEGRLRSVMKESELVDLTKGNAEPAIEGIFSEPAEPDYASDYKKLAADHIRMLSALADQGKISRSFADKEKSYYSKAKESYTEDDYKKLRERNSKIVELLKSKGIICAAANLA